jgi:hypothetical protein
MVSGDPIVVGPLATKEIVAIVDRRHSGLEHCASSFATRCRLPPRASASAFLACSGRVLSVMPRLTVARPQPGRAAP